jgi:hypothetical protein
MHHLIVQTQNKRRSMKQEGQSENSISETQGHSASMAPIKNGVANIPNDDPKIDDRGTDQSEASQILKNIRDAAFDSSNEKLALALGRPPEEIEEWIGGAGTIDGDAVLKARALASERGLEIE